MPKNAGRILKGFRAFAGAVSLFKESSKKAGEASGLPGLPVNTGAFDMPCSVIFWEPPAKLLSATQDSK